MTAIATSTCNKTNKESCTWRMLTEICCTMCYEHGSDGLKFDVKCNQRKCLIWDMADERDMFESTARRRFQRRGSRLKYKWNEKF